uniref:TYR_PHOSPHATASE_2 domain-containing protein n=1 Tax=Wuchereria bancrofti TaxID=6293 RepID=A0A1I8EG83_WUCBA
MIAGERRMESSTARRPTPAYFKPAPSEIQYGRMRFLITDRPSDLTINTYIELITKWLSLAKESFKLYPNQCIAVHCVAGLGRAPVLVAIALMEAGMKYEDAVDLIRRHRRGALNQKQLNFLQKYKSTGQLRKLRYNVEGKPARCSLM